MIYGNLRKTQIKLLILPLAMTAYCDETSAILMSKKDNCKVKCVLQFGSYYIAKKCQMIFHVYHDIIKLHFVGLLLFFKRAMF